MLQIPELLAPAGDLERLRYAINYGADAVYCSLPEFGMRAAPANFTPEQLAEGVIYAHARGRKVYLTMNTLPTKDTMSAPISTYVNRYLMARSRFNPTMERGIRLARMVQSAGFSGAVLR